MQLSSLAPRTRALLARRPWISWTIILLIAAFVAAVVNAKLSALDRQRDTWGSTAEVWVTRGPVAAGQALTAESRRYPRAMVPSAHVRADPSGAITRHRLEAGEIVVETDLSVTGIRGLIDDGFVAVQIPGDYEFVEVGDAVRLVSEQHAVDGTAVDAGEAAIVVAVPAADAARLAEAALSGRVAVALLGATPAGSGRAG